MSLPVPASGAASLVIHAQFTEFISSTLTLSSPNCVTDPLDCCSITISPPSGAGAAAIVVEYKEISGDFTVGETWCEVNPICCFSLSGGIFCCTADGEDPLPS